MQFLSIGLSTLVFIAVVLVGARARPTFDKIVDVLLDELNARPRPGTYGPAYGQSYDYYYGGGHGYGYKQPSAPATYVPYPAPLPYQEVRPLPGYYAVPQYPYRQPNTYEYSDRSYAHDHGRSSTGRVIVGADAGSTGGYKKHGY